MAYETVSAFFALFHAHGLVAAAPRLPRLPRPRSHTLFLPTLSFPAPPSLRRVDLRLRTVRAFFAPRPCACAGSPLPHPRLPRPRRGTHVSGGGHTATVCVYTRLFPTLRVHCHPSRRRIELRLRNGARLLRPSAMRVRAPPLPRLLVYRDPRRTCRGGHAAHMSDAVSTTGSCLRLDCK